MGMNMSSMGIGLNKGASVSQILSLVTDKLYDKFVEKDVEDFAGFLCAILDTFSAINSALPGKHYDPPPLKDLTDLFNEWKKEASDEKRKQIFTEFMKKNVNMNKVDEAMIITAIVAPPTAVVAKRTGQTLPQLKLMKSVPDVVFVPTATVAALVAVKILRYMFMGKTISKYDAIPPRPKPEPAPPTISKADAIPPTPKPEPTPPTSSFSDSGSESDHAPPNFYCKKCDHFHTAEELAELKEKRKELKQKRKELKKKRKDTNKVKN